MKNLIFIGSLLLVISGLLFYFTTNFDPTSIQLSHFIGIMGGVGIGLIAGGVIGYRIKALAIKSEQKKEEYQKKIKAQQSTEE